MFEDPLDDYEVAYFIFPYEDCHSFWNNNVDFPLTLAFLDKDHCVIDFKDLETQSKKSVSPNANNVKYVIEANKGTFDKCNIKKGDKIFLQDGKLKVKRFF